MKIDKNSRKGRVYRWCLLAAIEAGIFSFCFLWLWEVWQRVPSSIRVIAGTEQALEFMVPATATIYGKDGKTPMNVELNQELTFYGEAEDTYTMDVALFGFIPFKKSEVSVIQDVKLTPVGCPVGIYVKTDGVLVIDTGSFNGNKGKKVAPAENLLKPGDYIHKINGEVVESKEALIKTVADCQGKMLNLEVVREEETVYLKIQPQMDGQGEYKLGIWVRDNAQGIGTLTYVDENGYFGALGHGINDVDTSNLMDMKKGGLYKTDIIAISKGVNGTPGELTGVIAYSEQHKLGEIYQNTQMGIYGVLEREEITLEEEPLPIALKQEIKEGAAQIICTLSNEPEYYEVEITAIYPENNGLNRQMEIRVTDPKLLELTGGVVQGMSGSPIIQNGKIVGAVTHVLVNDPTRGYGIFIENMLDAAT